MNSEVLSATLNTVALGLVVALAAGALGCVSAWWVCRTDFWGRRWLASILAVPYALPSYLIGMSWVVLGNPSVGILKDFLPEQGAYGFWGMAWVEASVAFSLVYLEMRAGFSRMDPALEEAARMSGAGPFEVFRRISFPLLWPSLINGMCLAFLYTISSFGVPAILGLPVREFVLTTLIYSQFKLGGLDGIAVGFQLSLILLGLAGLAVGISYLLRRLQKNRMAAIAGAKSSRPSFVRLGPLGRWGASAGLFALLFLSTLLPWLVLGLSALAPVAGEFSPSQWTLRNLQYVLTLADFRAGLAHSVLLSLGVASAIVASGLILGYAAVRLRKKWAHAAIEAASFLYATPGTVLALALIMVNIWISRTLSPLGLRVDQVLLWIAIAYGLKYFAAGSRLMIPAFEQVHPALEEAARVSGASTWRVLWDIWTPILKKTWMSAWVLCVLPIFSELTMSVLLTGPGGETLGTVLFQLQEYADQPSAAALGWLLLTVALALAMISRERRADG